MIFGFVLIVVGFWIRSIALESQNMKLASPPLRNEDWITDKCAAHLANVPVARIRQAVQSEGLAAKTKLIGHKRFDLVSRSEIVEHFDLDHKSCLASCE